VHHERRREGRVGGAGAQVLDVTPAERSPQVPDEDHDRRLATEGGSEIRGAGEGP
jgi:hypothetical protein